MITFGVITKNAGHNISVRGPNNKSLMLPYDQDLSSEDNHVMAAYNACKQFGIGVGNLHMARLPDESGYVFVLSRD